AKETEVLKPDRTYSLTGRAGLRGGELLLPRETINPLALSTCSAWLKKLLSLVTFFAAAKKVTPPPGGRLLHKQHNKQ
uniref:hypothetical protein n=1 Tax=Caballeronia sp. BR00000012568055 TaxID=2918761 RepID=UPI0023F925C6